MGRAATSFLDLARFGKGCLGSTQAAIEHRAERLYELTVCAGLAPQRREGLQLGGRWSFWRVVASWLQSNWHASAISRLIGTICRVRRVARLATKTHGCAGGSLQDPARPAALSVPKVALQRVHLTFLQC